MSTPTTPPPTTDQLRDMIVRLLNWEAAEGGFEARVWRDARKLVYPPNLALQPQDIMQWALCHLHDNPKVERLEDEGGELVPVIVEGYNDGIHVRTEHCEYVITVERLR